MKSTTIRNSSKPRRNTVERKLQRIERTLASVAPEVKHIQLSATTLTTNLLNSTPQVIPLNICSQGTGETNRIGDKIRCKRLMLKVHMGSASALTTASMVQAMVIREKTTLGSALSPSQFFDSSTPSPQIWQRNVTTRDPSRFHLVWSSGCRTIGASQSPNNTLTYNFADSNLVCLEADIPLEFVTDLSRGNAGTVADIDTNGLNLVIFTANPTANGIYATYSYTIDFTDA